MEVVEIHRAPGRAGVLVEESPRRPRVWRWPGWAANDNVPARESSSLLRDGWASTDDYYTLLEKGLLR